MNLDIILLIIYPIGLAFLVGAFSFYIGFKFGKKGGPISIEDEEPEPTEPTEFMVPQSTVNKMLDEVDIAAKQRAEVWKIREEKKIRADAIKRHKNVIKGKTTEHLIPYMEDFKYNPSDCRFMGSPIDMVVFDGLTDGDVKEVIFLEIKTGPSANLSTRERKVRDAIKDGRVSWTMLRKNK